MSHAKLRDADLSDAKLTSANLSGAKLVGADLYRADVSRAAGATDRVIAATQAPSAQAPTTSCPHPLDEYGRLTWKPTQWKRVRVALRVAFPRSSNHHVTVRDRHYTYRYRSWNFNFHHHGKLGRRYADVVVCLAMEPRDSSREEVFVIPWEAVSGKTFSLHAGRRRYAGQYAKYVNRWQVITQAVAETPAPLRKVA